jgi:hypothetical protein
LFVKKQKGSKREAKPIEKPQEEEGRRRARQRKAEGRRKKEEEEAAGRRLQEMSGAKPENDKIVAKAAGFVVLGGVAWSLYKTVGPLILSPKKKTRSYDILLGDTLFSIAQRNGVSSDSSLPPSPAFGRFGCRTPVNWVICLRVFCFFP